MHNIQELVEQALAGIRRVKCKLRRGLEVAYSPSNVSAVIAQSIVEAPDEDRMEILERFVEMKQRELTTVLLSCALVASLIASLMSWNWFPVPAFTAKTVALCALIHSVVATGIAAQQLISLTRAHIHPHRTEIMQRVLFGYVLPLRSSPRPDVGPASQSDKLNVGSSWRHFSWQIPTMMLGNSIVFTLVALAITVFDEARKAEIWRTPEIATAVCVALSLAFSISCYIVSWLCVEWQMQEAITTDSQLHA